MFYVGVDKSLAAAHNMDLEVVHNYNWLGKRVVQMALVYVPFADLVIRRSLDV